MVFRALQGDGASGIFSLTVVIEPDITPGRWLGLYSSVISSVFAFTSILGPELGSALAEYSSWRWVFLLKKRTCGGLKLRVGKWKHIDILGVVLLLASTVLFIYALQSAPSSGSGQGWSSPTIIGGLVASGVLLTRYSCRDIRPYPLSSRYHYSFARYIALLMVSFHFTIIQLPQCLLQVNTKSPTTVGILVLAIFLPSAAFSALFGGLYRKFPTAPLQLFLGGCFQVRGVGLLPSLPTGLPIASKQYGFEVITGVGFGLMLPSVLILARDWTSKELYDIKKPLLSFP
ncbi:hypothetical protein SAPIO_CDS3335 [Scedosporium apiospermum]|uniref:Major facilitator superfamily (MFS) profile domain-containing protein n=1 Tax=Pseudallescheria apiosperma TaxID=563466 RepID=A0A084GAJ3_PSEDA|nr:uncharacterized protein SAPIO_CDS3335 [Scedosporium apiospermum]KEZ44355.1 hypothetical protein SAPIO_CDS3335 [Scedosporium apiospermum]